MIHDMTYYIIYHNISFSKAYIMMNRILNQKLYVYMYIIDYYCTYLYCRYHIYSLHIVHVVVCIERSSNGNIPNDIVPYTIYDIVVSGKMISHVAATCCCHMMAIWG